MPDSKTDLRLAVLIDADSGAVLYEMNSRTPPGRTPPTRP